MLGEDFAIPYVNETRDVPGVVSHLRVCCCASVSLSPPHSSPAWGVLFFAVSHLWQTHLAAIYSPAAHHLHLGLLGDVLHWIVVLITVSVASALFVIPESLIVLC